MIDWKIPPVFSSTRALVFALLLVIACTRVAIALAHPDSLMDHGMYQDDAYYYLQIARNAVMGRGLSFDESGATSGFQPLYQLLLLPIVAVSGDGPLIAVRGSLLMLAAWAVATGALAFSLGRALGGSVAGLTALGLFAFSPYFIVFGANGQETGLAMFFALGVARAHVWLFHDGVTRGPRAGVGYGVLAGFAVLARLDLAMLLVALVCSALLSARDRADAFVRGRALVLVTVTALLVWLPWSAYSQHTTGNWLPLSGAASREVALNLGWYEMDRVWSDPQSSPVFDPTAPPTSFYADVLTKLGAVALMEFPLLSPLRSTIPFTPWSGVNQYPAYRLFLQYPVILSLTAAAAIACLVVFLVRRRMKPGLGLTLMIYAALLAFGYGYAVPTHWYFPRYLAPALLLGSVVGVAAAARMLARYEPRRRRVIAALAIALILAAPLRDLSFFRTLSFGADTPPSPLRAPLTRAQGILPPDARLGAFQAGLLSWYAGGGVINLDGKVNSDAYHALVDGRLHEYLRDSGITHVLDWEWVFMRMCLRYAPDGSVFVEPLDRGAHAYESTLYRLHFP